MIDVAMHSSEPSTSTGLPQYLAELFTMDMYRYLHTYRDRNIARHVWERHLIAPPAAEGQPEVLITSSAVQARDFGEVYMRPNFITVTTATKPLPTTSMT